MSEYNKQIVNNSIFSTIQIIVVSATAFFLYKYIVETLGVEKLGLWSLILSVTSLATIGNLGFTGSLIKFSAEFSVDEEYKKINAILNSSVLGVGVILAVLLSIVYFLGVHFIDFLVDTKWIQTGQVLLFYALFSLYINIIAGLYFSVLEGVNLAFLKSIALIISTLIYLILAMSFIGRYDIIGLGYAQVGQALIYFGFGIFLCIFKLKQFNFFYFKWHKKLMKDVFNYGLNFQMIGLAQMLYDPITKAILSKFGGLDFVAIFEMSSKLVMQVRAIVATIIQNLVPKIVKLNSVYGTKKIISSYKRINDINLFLIFSSIAIIIPFANIISILLLETSDINFVYTLLIVSTGWMINSLNIPSYIVNLGTSHLRWNVFAHIIIGVLNFFLCIIFGYLLKNGIVIVAAWTTSLIIGSFIIIIEFHKRQLINLCTIFNQLFFKLIASYAVLLAVSYSINTFATNLIVLICLQSLTVIIYLWFIVFKIKEVNDIVSFILKTKSFKKIG